MLTGGYPRLPKCLEVVGSRNKLSTHEEKYALRKLDGSLWYKVLFFKPVGALPFIKVDRRITTQAQRESPIAPKMVFSSALPYLLSAY
jgi:hypothetical protein